MCLWPRSPPAVALLTSFFGVSDAGPTRPSRVAVHGAPVAHMRSIDDVIKLDRGPRGRRRRRRRRRRRPTAGRRTRGRLWAGRGRGRREPWTGSALGRGRVGPATTRRCSRRRARAAAMAAVWSPRAVRVAAVFAAFGFISHFVPSEPFLTQYLIDVKGFTEAEVRACQCRHACETARARNVTVRGRARAWPGHCRSTTRYTRSGRTRTSPSCRSSGRSPRPLATSVRSSSTRWPSWPPAPSSSMAPYARASASATAGPSAGLTPRRHGRRCLCAVLQTLASMKAMQVTYGLSTATDVAFYTYIYRLIEEEAYQRVVRTWRRCAPQERMRLTHAGSYCRQSRYRTDEHDARGRADWPRPGGPHRCAPASAALGPSTDAILTDGGCCSQHRGCRGLQARRWSALPAPRSSCCSTSALAASASPPSLPSSSRPVRPNPRC